MARKSNEQFLQEMQIKAPEIILLGKYQKSNIHIECECKKCGHRWSAIPNNLLRGEGCPKCGGNIKKDTQQFANELKTINSSLIVVGEYVNCKTKIKYICKRCGREDEKIPSSLLKGHGCKYCAREKMGKARRHTNEWFIEELKVKNPGIVPLEPYSTTSKKMLCRCVCGEVWTISPSNLLQGKRCKKCMGRKSAERQTWTNEEFVEKLNKVNPNIEPLEKYNGINNDITCRCKICGNTWQVKPQQLFIGRGCRSCQKRWQTSFPEQALYYYIKNLYTDAVNSYSDGFGPSELDIYIPSLKIGIEYDGRARHKTVSKVETKKYDICKKRGIFLIRVRERTEDVQLGQICDLTLHSEYGDTKKYYSLDDCIRRVLDFLHVDINVDTEKDAVVIKENYYSMIKNRSLGAEHPEIAKEWDYSKNGNINPYMVLPNCNDSYNWICPKCGRSYSAKVYSRTKGHGCSKCAGVMKKDTEEFITEMSMKRPNLIVLGEYVNADTGILLKCRLCGSEFKAKPHSILKGNCFLNGCKACGRKKQALEKILPEEEFLKRAKEKSPNIEIIGKYINSHKRIQCQCRICGNIWNPIASTLYLNTTGCNKCAGNGPVRIICIETGEIFKSMGEAEKKKNISHSTLSRCINGKGKTAGGFHWKRI